MTRMKQTHRTRAFTLLEMLVVISIILILVGIVIGAGVGVVDGRRKSVTQNVLLTLDRAMEEYIQINGSPPPFIAYMYAETPGLDVFPGDRENSPSVDTNAQKITGETIAFIEYPENSNVYLPRFPDASVFISQAQGFGEFDAVITGLAQWLQPTVSTTIRGSYGTFGAGASQSRADVTAPSVRDNWADAGWRGDGDVDWPILEGQLVLYVHPSNHLAQGLYGRCKNGRPYFMSAGKDGKFGVTNEFSSTGARSPAPDDIRRAIDALDDNLYSYQPDPPLGVSGSNDDQESDPFNVTYR